MNIFIFQEIFISAQNSRRLKWNSRRFIQLKIPGDLNGIPGEIQEVATLY